MNMIPMRRHRPFIWKILPLTILPVVLRTMNWTQQQRHMYSMVIRQKHCLIPNVSFSVMSNHRETYTRILRKRTAYRLHGERLRGPANVQAEGYYGSSPV